MRGLIVLPSYNEGRSLGAVLARIAASGLTEDLLVVDDGSTDDTRQVLIETVTPFVRHPINLGYVRALQTGLRYANARGYDYLVFMDADGQHDPRHVASLKARGLAEGGPDIVIGSRFAGGGRYDAPLGRRVGMRFFSWLTRLIGGRRIHDTTSGFKLLRRRAFGIVMEQVLGDFHAEMLIHALRAGLRVEEVPVVVARREHGASMYDGVASLVYPLKTMLAICVMWVEWRRWNTK
ncbi:MAG: glycosyltransferase family 2 protein [Planctomycetota bacterium]